MKWSISYNNKLIEGNSFNEVFIEITKNVGLFRDLVNGAKLVGYREGVKFIECGTWYIKEKQLFYQANNKQFKNRDGDLA